MAEKYKSVLEKYNESKKPRLPTAEEEAIEPVYPEEYLIGGGGGKLTTSALRSRAEREAEKAATRGRIANTKIGSYVPDPEAVAAEKAMRDKFYETSWGKATYDDLKKQAEQRAKQQAKAAIIDEAKQSNERAQRNLYGEAGNIIGNEIYQQRQNAAGDTYKKGGKVKATASSRGDGIAKRGKTKGRMV